MAKPRSPELARSGRTPLDPDSTASTAPLEHDVHVHAGAPFGPIPKGNRPPEGDEGGWGDSDALEDDRLDDYARMLGLTGSGPEPELVSDEPEPMHDDADAPNDAT